MSTSLASPSPSAVPGSDALARGLRHVARAPGVAVVHVPAPLGDPFALLDEALSDRACVFVAPPRERHDPSGTAIAGVGDAVRVDASGHDRFRALRDAARRVLAGVEAFGDGPAPRMLGGLAYAPGSAEDALWHGFGDASFALPRWTYVRHGARATLSFAALPEDRALDAAQRELAQITRSLSMGSRTFAPPAMQVEHEQRAVWAERVRAACEEIAAGRLEKVVVARRSVLRFERAVCAIDVVRRLASRHADACTIFAIRRGAATFLGATPELLVAVHGRTVRTEALAGSVDVARSDHAALLFHSAKDRREHAFVAREIERRLAPLCRVARTAEIRVRRLSNVAHLVSPIYAELAEDAHVLDVAAVLHPTPAVLGVPAAAAARFVERTEPYPRGWYAGPVGWLDAQADGELWVALRSGVFSGVRAEVHAGAGIVQGSSPDAEYAETALKLDAILRAAGIEGASRLLAEPR